MKADRTFNNLHRRLFPLITYLISFSFFTVLFWPYLWENPTRNFIDTFSYMGKFPITYDILYLGKFIKSTKVPWHYIPVWVLITTPILYTFYFLIGSFQAVKGTIKNGISLYSNDRERQDFLFMLLFIVPLASVILMNSNLYDGWRHLYFIYAPFLLIAMIGAAKMLGFMNKAGSTLERYGSLFMAAVTVLSLFATSYPMIRYHPFQNVYFNILAGSDVDQRFELDYWGLSFRKGLEYIVNNDKRPVIGLSANATIPMRNNFIFLEKRDLDRLRITDVDQADYFMTNYRWHPGSYSFADEVYTVSAYDLTLLSVFKLR
jgi:hypothetical protein